MRTSRFLLITLPATLALAACDDISTSDTTSVAPQAPAGSSVVPTNDPMMQQSQAATAAANGDPAATATPDELDKPPMGAYAITTPPPAADPSAPPAPYDPAKD